MGRAKLEMKYREQVRARVNTYKSRIKGMEKKAKELSVLCGVDVMFASFSPDLNAFDYWPNESSKFHRIIDRYRYCISSQKPPAEVPSPPVSSLTSKEEELAAINKKLEEVRQMINFIETEKFIDDSSPNMRREDSIGVDDLNLCPDDGAATLNEQDEEIFSLLDELGEDLLVSDDHLLSSNSSVDACNESYFDWVICSESLFDADHIVHSDLV